jgi:hypothetical protein
MAISHEDTETGVPRFPEQGYVFLVLKFPV